MNVGGRYDDLQQRESLCYACYSFVDLFVCNNIASNNCGRIWMHFSSVDYRTRGIFCTVSLSSDRFFPEKSTGFTPDFRLSAESQEIQIPLWDVV